MSVKSVGLGWSGPSVRALVMALAAFLTVGVDLATAQGTVTTPILSGDEEADAIAIQADGKIVVAGWTNNGGVDDDFAVVRYNVDFTLDTSFDGDGIVVTSFGVNRDRANALAIQSDGKIVVAGHSDQGDLDFAAARYNPDGSLDGTFGTGGKVTTDIGTASSDNGRAVGIDSNGNIVVAGYSDTNGDNDFTVVRYDSTGTLDGTFGTGGKVTTDVGTNSDDQAEAVAIEPDDQIVVAGDTGGGAFKDFGVVRYNTNGTPDGSFGTGGIVTTDFDGNEDSARFIAIQSDGKIVVAGSRLLGDWDFALVRYDANGTPDPGFGASGEVTTDFNANSADFAFSVILQDDGQIVTGGYSNAGGTLDFAVARYDATNGSLDLSFSTDGKATADLGGTEWGFGVAFESSGNIVITGSSNVGGDYDFALARFCPNGTVVSNYAGGFGYRKAIRIFSDQVAGSSDLVDFPVLIHVTDPNLADTGNGGNVQRSDGSDIVFREGCGQATLDHEVESYNNTTGELMAWVRVPLLRHNMDTIVYAYYGNAGVACATENPDGVWADHRAVWHLDEPSAGPFIDSSANPNDAVAAATAPFQVAGQIGSALQFDTGTDRHLAVSDHDSLDLPTNMTVSAWVSTSSADAQDRVILARWGPAASGWQNYFLGKIANTDLAFYVDGGAAQSVSTPITDINDGSWHYVVAVADAAGSSLRLYVDGVLRNSTAYDGTSETGSEELHFANNPGWPSQYWDGTIDEGRISAVARSTGWVQTEFNNQSSPGSFVELGDQDTAPFNASWVFGYRKKLTVDNTKVTCGSDVSDFPVLVSLVDPDLRTVADGGRVQSSFGYDIVFRDSTGQGTLAFEIEEYTSDPVNGTLVAWVNVSTLGASADTDLYMYYGNAAVSCPWQTQYPGGVWDPNFEAVWHLREKPTGASYDIQDSTSNNVDGTSSNMGAGNRTSGQIDGSLLFDGAAEYIGYGGSAVPFSGQQSYTLSGWLRFGTDPSNTSEFVVEKGGNYWLWWNGANDFGLPDNSLIFGHQVGAGQEQTAQGWAPVQNTWYHVVGVHDASTDTHTVYVNGGVLGSQGGMASDIVDLGGLNLEVGRRSAGDRYFNGTLDEVRISSTARAQCWVETEYNNQSWPTRNAACNDGGFICVGAEEVSPPTAVELASFNASGGDGEVSLTWETGSERNNLGFNLYRATAYAGPYLRLTSQLIPGLGSSPEGNRYRYLDSRLENGVTYYYKLEDVESTGETALHGPVWTTPGAEPDAGGEAPRGEETSSSRLAFGQPEQNRLQVLSSRDDELVLELVTAGFYAVPQEDGTVRLEIPDFTLTEEVGLPAVPVRRSWVEVPAGRQVQLDSVTAYDEKVFDGLRPSSVGVPAVEVSGQGAVRALRRRRRRLGGGAPSVYPRQRAQLLGTAFQEQVKKALVEMAPLRWDEAQNGLVLAHRLVVRLRFGGRDPSERTTSGRRGRRYRHDSSHERHQVVSRFATRDAGLYAVDVGKLLGRPRDLDQLRLSRQGETVPFHLEGTTLYFVSVGEEGNPYGSEAAYELELGVLGERMAMGSARPTGAPTDHYWELVRREEDRIYQPALVDAPDRWLWKTLFAPARESTSFDVSGLASTTDLPRLKVWLQGASDFAANPDHHVRVSVNGNFLGEASWNGKEAMELDLELGAGVLHEGENLLEVENVRDTEAAYSMVMLNRFQVSYPRRLEAMGGRLQGSWSQSGTAEVIGVGPGSIVLEDSEDGPVWLEGQEPTPTGIRFRAESGRSYRIVSPEAVRQAIPRDVPRATGLKTTTNRADVLLIGPRAFLGAASPLLELRRRQGLRAKAVAAEDLFSEFGFGEETPRAIKSFIAYAYHNWKKAPRYVVLLGDGTYDFKDRLGTGVKNQVPPMMVMTSYVETASDPAYAAVNGEDSLPDLAIGRLPAATVEELRAMVEKIVAFETSGSSFGGRTVLVSDNPDSAGDFVSDAERLAASTLSSREVEKIYLSELGTAETRYRIQRAFNDGASLLSYIGHGGIHLWAVENILNNDDVATLTPQGNQPLLLTMNCLNGYFHFPYMNSLSEELLKAEGKGVVAAFSPSGFSVNSSAQVFHRLLLEELVHGGHARLGDAVLAAQSAYAASGALPELIAIYHLFGDPALRLR